MLFFNITELWMMAARGKAPRGIDRVLLEIGHVLAKRGDAALIVFDPRKNQLHRAPNDWLSDKNLDTPERWSHTANAPRRRHFAKWHFPPRRPDIRLSTVQIDPKDTIISLGRPEMIAALLKRRPNARHMVMIHDTSMALGIEVPSRRLIRRQRNVLRDICASKAELLTPSAITRDNIRTLHPNTNPTVLRLAYHYRTVTAPPPPITQPYFLHVGPLKFWKNGPRLIDAYTRARAQNPSLPKLVLAGHLTRQSAAHIHVVPSPDHAAMQALYQNCHGLILPSRAEGFALPLGEALFFGKPIAASRILSPLLPSASGDIILFDPDSTDDMVKAILTLAGAKAAQLQETRSWTSVADELLAQIATFPT
jgi:glycosyltransferase involved in cell wall biosynthesis